MAWQHWPLVLLLLQVPIAWGWGYSASEYPPPAAWELVYPACRNQPTTPQSPIALAGVGGNESYSTVSIMLAAMQNATGSVPLGSWSIAASATSLTLRVSRSTPGLLAATAVSRGSALGGTSSPISFISRLSGRTTSLAFRQLWLRVGTEHSDVPVQTPGALPPSGPAAELQFLFRDAATDAAALLVCLPLYGGDPSKEHPLVADLLDQMSSSAVLLSVAGASSVLAQAPMTVRIGLFPDRNGSTTTAAAAATAADLESAAAEFSRMLLPLAAADARFGTFVAYRGSVTTPPCEGPLQVVVSRQVWSISAASLQSVRDLTAGADANARRPFASPLSVNVYSRQVIVIANRSLETLSELQGLGRSETNTTDVFLVQTSRNDRMRTALIVLTALAIVEVLVVMILLAVRWELIDLPTSWGGLARPVEFWQNPISHHTWDDVSDEGSDGDASEDASSGGDGESIEESATNDGSDAPEEDRRHLSWSFEQ